MEYLGKTENDKDMVNKKYVDEHSGITVVKNAVSQIYGVSSGTRLTGSSSPTLLPLTTVYNTNPDRICAAINWSGIGGSYSRAVQIIADDINWVRLDAQMSLASGAASGSSIYLYMFRNGEQVATLGWERITAVFGYVNAAGILVGVTKGDMLQLYGRVTAGSPTLGGGFLTRFTVSEV